MRAEAVGGDRGQLGGNGTGLVALTFRFSQFALSNNHLICCNKERLPRLVALALQLFSKFDRNNMRRNCISSNESFPSFGIRLWCRSSAHKSLSNARAFTINRLAFSMRS